MLLGRALEEQDRGNVPGAIELLRAAVREDPGFERAKVRLAMLEQSPPGSP
jgi:hypothetical protein